MNNGGGMVGHGTTTYQGCGHYWTRAVFHRDMYDEVVEGWRYEEPSQQRDNLEMRENPARRPWTVGMWRVDNKSVDRHWTDSLSIIDADGGEVCVLTRGYEADENGEGCPSWKNAVLIVAAVNAFKNKD